MTKKPYKVVYKKLKRGFLGLANYPSPGVPAYIEINEKLLRPGQEFEHLSTLIHETIHLTGAGQHLTEESVLELEEAIARQLWAGGYRLHNS